jgi:hypothetical protein
MRLFNTVEASQAEVMAEAFTTKSVWDLRWYRFKLWLYTSTAAASSILMTSAIEHIWDISFWRWLWNL